MGKGSTLLRGVGGLLAAGFSYVPLVLLLVWLLTRLGKGVEGFGTSWDEPWLVFNWHPLCMVIAYTTLYAHAALAFRALPFSRNVNKVIHALIQTLGLAASTGGLATVIIFKDKTGNDHMYSLHAWLGISSYSLFAIQWLFGVGLFVPPLFGINFPPESLRRALRPVHMWAGVMIYVGCTAAILTGLMDRQWIYNAFQNPNNDSYGSETFVVNFVAITVLLSVWMVLAHHFPNPLDQKKHDAARHDSGIYQHLGGAQSVNYHHLA